MALAEDSRLLNLYLRQRRATGRPVSPREQRAAYISYWNAMAERRALSRGLEAEQERLALERRGVDLEQRRIRNEQQAAEQQGYYQAAGTAGQGALIYGYGKQQGWWGGGGGTTGGGGGTTQSRAGTYTSSYMGGQGGAQQAGAQPNMSSTAALHRYESGGGGQGATAGGESGAGAGGGGSWWTTQGRYGAGWKGSATGLAAGGATGYAVSPYGAQAEYGMKGYGPGTLAAKGTSFGVATHSRRRGARIGMVAAGAGSGTVAGGFPMGTIGGAIGGYFQKNPETGERGYEETYKYELKPAYKQIPLYKLQEPVSGLGVGIGQKTAETAEQAIKDTSPKKLFKEASDKCIIITTATELGHEAVTIAREYRDKFLDKITLRGYYRVAQYIVPWMKQDHEFKKQIKVNLVDKLIEFGRYMLGGDVEPSGDSIKTTEDFISLCRIYGEI